MKLDGVEITWLGHAAFRFRLDDGTTFVVDPFLTNNPLCPAEEKQPEQVDVIFVTHGHRDHLGDTASVARSTGATVFSIFEIKRWLMQQGVEDDRTVPLNKGGTVSVAAGVKATFVHAVHSSGIYGEEGMINGGAAGGWVIDFPGGAPFTTPGTRTSLETCGSSENYGSPTLPAFRSVDTSQWPLAQPPRQRACWESRRLYPCTLGPFRCWLGDPIT